MIKGKAYLIINQVVGKLRQVIITTADNCKEGAMAWWYDDQLQQTGVFDYHSQF